MQNKIGKIINLKKKAEIFFTRKGLCDIFYLEITLPQKGGELLPRTTIKMIADKLGVSVSTVNRALINKGRISEETKRKILKTAEEMGYRPNVQAKALSSKDTLRIAVICPRDFYFKTVIEGMESYRKEHEEYRIKLLYKCDDFQSVADQLSALQECEHDEVQGILISAVHPTQLNKQLRLLFKKGIPTITFNNDILGGPRIAYVGLNDRVAGAMAGELMSKYLFSGARVACMATTSAAMGLRERQICFCDTVQKSGKNIEICGPFEYCDNFDLDDILEKVTHILRTEHVNGIYANNMFGTYAISCALRKLGMKDKIVAIGHDVNAELDAFIRDGVLDATLFQNPFQQGYQALKVMVDYLYLKVPVFQPILYIRTLILMKSNLEECDNRLFL